MTMEFVYPDTSAWNCLCHQGVEPSELMALLATCDASLALGLNVMYEMGKLFVKASPMPTYSHRFCSLFSTLLNHLDSLSVKVRNANGKDFRAPGYRF